MGSSTRRRPLLGAVIVPVLLHLCFRSLDLRARLSRATVLRVGGLGLAGLFAGGAAAARAAGAVVRPGERTGPPVDAATIMARGCARLAPEETQGPYYIAREKIRGNIRENRKGVPLKLEFTVIDVKTCSPIKDAAVDIWHCDGGGVYSGFIKESEGGSSGPGGGPTDKHTFLRGIQFTDANGLAQFETIYPGWYSGRTVHIHVKVHAQHHAVGDVVHTGQLYFHDSLTSKVYQSSQPYKRRAAARDTFNGTDQIYLQGGGSECILNMRSDGNHGYVGSIALGVVK